MQAVEDALNAGHEKFTGRDREAVKKAMHSVRLDAGLAKVPSRYLPFALTRL